jgi:sensor histidine kinase YesM
MQRELLNFYIIYHLCIRYNLSGINSTVTLIDEIKNVKDYSALMKVRFGDRIDFIFDVKDEDLSVEMPPLILQPIIENAFIHGFMDKESDCIIKVSVGNYDDYTLIEVNDNGSGIEEDILENLINSNFTTSGKSKNTQDELGDHHGHTTGLGMSNVYERLKGFYGKDDVLDIKSVKNIGTSVVLKAYHKTI